MGPVLFHSGTLDPPPPKSCLVVSQRFPDRGIMTTTTMTIEYWVRAIDMLSILDGSCVCMCFDLCAQILVDREIYLSIHLSAHPPISVLAAMSSGASSCAAAATAPLASSSSRRLAQRSHSKQLPLLLRASRVATRSSGQDEAITGVVFHSLQLNDVKDQLVLQVGFVIFFFYFPKEERERERESVSLIRPPDWDPSSRSRARVSPAPTTTPAAKPQSTNRSTSSTTSRTSTTRSSPTLIGTMSLCRDWRPTSRATRTRRESTPKT